LVLDAPSEIEAIKKAKAKRQEEIEAGINDDIDQTFAVAADSVGDEDFEMVEDFYQPIQKAVRRNSAPHDVKISTGTSLSDSVIASAMAKSLPTTV
jgi:hypothetical protein